MNLWKVWDAFLSLKAKRSYYGCFLDVYSVGLLQITGMIQCRVNKICESGVYFHSNKVLNSLILTVCFSILGLFLPRASVSLKTIVAYRIYTISI